MTDRRLSMPRQPLGCAVCGWVGFAPPLIIEGRDARGNPVDADPGDVTVGCPVCGAACRLPARPREVIDLNLFAALRKANISVDNLALVSDAVEQAGPEISPREMAAALPAEMAPVVTAASRFGSKEWLAVLAIVVSGAVGLMGVDAARDAERARHTDAKEALRSAQEAAKAKGTADLTDEDIAELSRRVQAHLESQRAKQNAQHGTAERETHRPDQ